jgi:xanthine dehydrogenase FAD-binding subunit
VIKELEYEVAHDLDEALALAATLGERKRVVAGGTDVVVRLKEGLIREDVLLDISGVEALRGIREENGWVHVGALVTHDELALSPVIQQSAPVLAAAARTVGGPQIRHRGTIGGNAANASPAGDTLPALVVLDALVMLGSVSGQREVPILDFWTGPGRSVCRSDELVTGFRFPRMGADDVAGFRKLGSRRAMTIATANVAVFFRLGKGGRITHARIASGSVAPTVVRLSKTEELFRQLPPVLSLAAVRGAAQMAWKEVAPIDDLRATALYRKEAVVGLLTETAYEALRGRWHEG